jgi:NAD(P)-dependent dehydrogenase (short-subunit alcohol dehydrogenase family)
MRLLENKVAVITGGASGIGKATAELFLKEGAKVVITDINEELGNQVAREMGENAFFVKANSASEQDNKRVVEEAVKKFGALHIAVNNAGIGGASVLTGEYPIEEWNKVININLNGVFYGMRHQLPEIEKAGGSIINIASILGSVGFANSSAYAAAKHGVVGLTKSAAWEYGTRGVRINAVGPGFISTPLVDSSLSKEALQYLESQHAFQRLGNTNEVAEMILWLASDKSSFATGGYYPIDGGYLAK